MLYELDETDNVASLPISIITPDLRGVSVSASVSAQFGEVFIVSVEGTNAGTAAATADWTDRIYLSAAANSLTGAFLLASIPAGTNSPLAAGASYSFSASVTAPLDASSLPGPRRIEELASQSTEGLLTDAERAEYEGYVRANKFVAILQRRARQIVGSQS